MNFSEQNSHVRARGTFALFSVCALLSSCAERVVREIDEDVRIAPTASPESLYERAAHQMHASNFKIAANSFAVVQEQFPYSTWAAQSQIMEGYCRYQAHQYEDAIDLFTIFAKLHPHHKDTPYARYMIGLCHYERIAIVARDQQDAYDALKAFHVVLTKFPACDYAKDAKFKVDFINNHLATQEMSIGRFYQHEKAYVAAMNRFSNVVTRYQTTEQCPEALFRLAECYATLDMLDDFWATYDVLKLNHPDSVWVAFVEKLVACIKEKEAAGSAQPGQPSGKKRAQKQKVATDKEIRNADRKRKDVNKKGKLADITKDQLRGNKDDLMDANRAPLPPGYSMPSEVPDIKTKKSTRDNRFSDKRAAENLLGIRNKPKAE
ncbi:MAG: outer membrane protein assembly factor BamD [Holosporales bacterium]|nr:outer membrane protein assembly factor BamD [Holosporales bacterium]